MKLCVTWTLLGTSITGTYFVCRLRLNYTIILAFCAHRSDVPIKLCMPKFCKKKDTEITDSIITTEDLGTHVIVREDGHYFGTCIFFNPPDRAPVGMDNKVHNMCMYS